MSSGYPESIGRGGMWIKEGKKGKYLSWSIQFPVNGNVPIVVNGVAFKNEKKEGKQPDYRMIVNGWKYPVVEDKKPDQKPKEEEDIPF